MVKAIVTAEEFPKLSKELQSEFEKQQDGRYMLKVESVDGLVLENTENLRLTLGKERKRADDAEKLATETTKGLEGLDLKAAREAMKKVEDMKSWTPEEKVRAQMDAVKKELADKHGAERTQLEGELKDLRGQLEDLLVVESARAAILSHAVDGKAPNVELLLPHVVRQIKSERGQDKKYVARVVDKDGNPRLTQKAGSTDAMTIEELVGSMRADKVYAPAFPGYGAAGAGSDSTNGGKGGGSGIDPSLPPAERLKLARRAG